jgi:cytochrome c-type biogenesis protein CcmF
MIPELGHFALILAFLLAGTQAFFGLAGAWRGRDSWLQATSPAVTGVWVFVALSYACLTYSFISHDFSVLYVATNSNSALPLLYRVAAVWGAHEGSLLLWIFILSSWSLAVAVFSTSLPPRFRGRVLGVLGLVAFAFMGFILATSSPFARLIPAALDGADLNPLLQDPALAIHPPMLYTGYVGTAVAFAFAVAAMLEGRLDAAWARWTRPWTTTAWLFLTIGIALGSWWAYYELGWGGWWFWDPVENASFMPWLAATALIHSLAVTEQRGLFKSWTLLLAVFAFSLSLLGTFLVRSGVLVSVHSFASDPSRGLFVLGLLTFFIAGSLALYTWRAPTLGSNAGFALVSRESFLLLNNALLVAAAGLILIGTLWPLLMDALDLGKISVGPPYFNLVFLVPALPLVLLVGVGMHATWKQARLGWLKRRFIVLAALGGLFAVVLPLIAYGTLRVLTVVGFAAAFFIMGSALMQPIDRLRRRQPLTRAVLGMCIAHFGVGLFTIGVTGAQSYTVEKDVALAVGEATTIAGYEFRFLGTHPVLGPNWEALEGEVTIRRNGTEVTVLHPQKRVYRVQKQPMTIAGITVGPSRDLFVALGEDLGAGRWSLRIQYKPLIRYIWLGAVCMAFGGGIAISDRRYRRRTAEASVAAAAVTRPAS